MQSLGDKLELVKQTQRKRARMRCLQRRERQKIRWEKLRTSSSPPLLAAGLAAGAFSRAGMSADERGRGRQEGDGVS
jgi:uncharacterized protein (DUF2062 family)